jgi:hypothetical protein
VAVVKRSGPLARKTPLDTRTALKRTTALTASPLARSSLHSEQAIRRQVSKAYRRRPSIPAKVRKALAVRSGGLCEILQPGCTGVAVEFAHRKKTGAGGRKGAAKTAHDVLSNALHACWTCHHRLCHARPAEAYVAGWMLREEQIPTSEPVLYRGQRRFLTDDGLVLTTNTAIKEEAA